jgi:hypothetical protein
MRSYFIVGIDFQGMDMVELEISYEPSGMYVLPNFNLGDIECAAKIHRLEVAKELASLMNDRIQKENPGNSKVARVVHVSEDDSVELALTITNNSKSIIENIKKEKVKDFPTKLDEKSKRPGLVLV